MQKIMTCLGFNDRAEDAVRFYTSVFKNSKILSTSRWGDSGPGPKGSVLAITFEIEGQRFLALNGGPPFNFSIGMSQVVNCRTQEEIDFYWERLSEGGEKGVCGWLTDKFGVSWQVTPVVIEEMLTDKDPQKRERVMQVILNMKKPVIAELQRAYDGAKDTSNAR